MRASRPSSPAQLFRPRSAPTTAGFTLIEVSVAATILTICVLGILGSLIQSRKMTESSIYQNSAVTIVQGYIEQMKNMDFTELPYYVDGKTLMRNGAASADDVIYTQLDSDTYDTLRLSPGLAPAASVLSPKGPKPEGAVNNLKAIDINDTPENKGDDLNMNIWVWISPLDNAPAAVGPSRRITMVYTWTFESGGASLSYIDTVTTIRSRVPSF